MSSINNNHISRQTFNHLETSYLIKLFNFQTMIPKYFCEDELYLFAKK